METLPDIHQMLARTHDMMLRDQHRVRQRLHAAMNLQRQGKPFETLLPAIAAEIERSVAVRAFRASHRPAVSYPSELPVSEKRGDIAEAIQSHQVVVVCGETGSGKTTQLPKICLELGRGAAGMIGHTQPRRIAARAVAARIAEELGVKSGPQSPVGFKVRFSDNTSPDTYIKLMTDGILLAETQGAGGIQDRMLTQYDTLIIDEAHERSLNIDFLLGYLHTLLPRRPDLKVIITSATIDPGSFSRHFNNCPIVMVSGRTYPVEVRYRDPHPAVLLEQEEDGRTTANVDRDEEEPDILQAIVSAVDECTRDGTGDILIFLSGEREIHEAADALEEHLGKSTEIIPLYSRQATQDQQRVFQPSRKRRIILATNVAETSLTVPGIKYVIDPGLARISRYSPRTKVQRLPIEPVSQASANQRKGRCGRISPGVCIRLYSEDDFNARPPFTEPEILRTNLASVILQMKALRLGNIEEFPFIERPPAKGVLDGYQTLVELGAVDARWNITPLGSQLARLPIDPRIARMILAAEREGCVDEVLIIAAALSVQDPRERPLDKQQAADTAHLPFRDEHSDFLSFLKLWKWYHDLAGGKDGMPRLSVNKLRRACQAAFLSFTRMREWHDIHQQLADMLSDLQSDRPRDRGRQPGRGSTKHRPQRPGLPLRPAAAASYSGASQGPTPNPGNTPGSPSASESTPPTP